MAGGSSISVPLTLPQPDAIVDSYTDGRGNALQLITNRYGSGTSYTDAIGNRTLVQRNKHNQISRIDYPNNAYQEYFYDSDNLLTDLSHSEGMSTSYTYDSLFRPININSSFSPDLNLTYDAQYNVTQLVIGADPDTVTADFTYNAFGLPLTRTVNGETTIYEYDANGRLIRETDSLSNVTEYGYDSAGNRTLVRDALNQETHFEYDASGRLTKITDPNGGITQFAYQSACATCGTGKHLLTSITDPAGNTTHFEYDEIGQLIRQTDPAGGITSYVYDASRNLASKTDSTGETITYEYDALDRLIRKTMPGDIVEYAYDSMGNMISVHDNDSQLDYVYDLANRLVSMTSSGPNEPLLTLVQDYQQFTYNRLNLSTAINNVNFSRGFTTDALLRMAHTENREDANILGTYQFGYDLSGRRNALIYPGGDSLVYGYDGANRLLTLGGTAFPGEITYDYDANGRRTTEQRILSSALSLSLALDQGTVTDPALLIDGQATDSITAVSVNNQAMTINAAGQIQGEIALSPGFNNLTVQVTDDIGRTTSQTMTVDLQPPATGVVVGDLADIAPNGDIYLIEGAGTAAVLTNSGSQVTRPSWLATASDAAVDSLERIYTVQGTQLWLHDANGDTLVADLSSLTVDDMEVGPDDQVYLAAGNLIYRVDALGNLVLHTTVPGAFTVILDSSAWGLVAGAFDGRNGTFYRVLGDGSLELIGITGRFTAFAVDGTGRLCYNTFGTEAVNGFECRAPDGTVSPLGITGDDNTRLEFDSADLLYITTGDNIHRLENGTEIALIGGTPVQGTLTILTDTLTDTGTASYTYNTRDQLIGVVRGNSANESYVYDAIGNRFNDHHAADYVYNNLNQLVSGNGAAYTYDADGNRITKTDVSGTTSYLYDAEHRLTRIDFPDGAYAEYAYDPFGRRIQKRVVDAQGGETIRRYVYDGEDILFELDGSGNLVTEYIHGPGIDEPLALRRNGQTYTYHADALGSIIAITDENDAIAQQYKYDAYGNKTFMLNPGFEQPYGFTGREYDPESGLYFYRARYYDPGIGKFITRDPIGFAGGDVNLYAYVLNNPINFIDPLGLESSGEPTQSQNIVDIIYEALGIPLGNGGGTVASTGKTLLEGGALGLKAYRELARSDYNFYKVTSLHRFEAFKDIDWDKYGDNFDDAFRNCPK